jgi:hypothetical protein
MPDSVYQQALLYACGELDSDEVAEFEARLSGEQDAREALVAAVSMVAPSSPLFEGGPDPAYRERVRHRLNSSLAGRHPHTRWGSHWLSALSGAAAAVLVMMLINSSGIQPRPAGEREAATTTQQPAAAPQAPATAETIYSELSNVERVVRVRDQQVQRRQRHDDLKLPHGLLENPTGKGSSM